MMDHLEKGTDEHLSLVSSEYKAMEAKYEDINHKRRSSIFMSQTSQKIPLSSYVVHSRFGQFGAATRIHLIPDFNAAIVHYFNDQGYGRALTSGPVNLQKHRLTVTPIHAPKNLFDV